jgi:uncharacterized phage protein gp47/JayE
MPDSLFTGLRGDTLKAAIFDLFKTNIGVELDDTAQSSPYDVLRGLAETIYELLDDAYEKIEYLEGQRTLDEMTGIYLDAEGLARGLPRNEASKAVGSFIARGYAGGTIAAGTWIVVDGTDLRFCVTADTPFVTAIDTPVPVKAEFTGSLYNLQAGTKVHASKVVQGLESVTVLAGWVSSAGEDDELDDPYRIRIKALNALYAEGNPPSKYEYLAAKISGVAQAKVIRAPRGWGSINVLIATAAGLPLRALLDQVATALNDEGLVCRDMQVRAPEALPVTFAVSYQGDVAEALLVQAIQSYVLAVSIGGRLELRDLYKTIAAKYTLSRFVITSPAHDIEAAASEKIIPTVQVTKL